MRVFSRLMRSWGQSLFQRRLDAARQSVALVAGYHDEVVGVSHQLGVGPMGRAIAAMEHVVEPV
jgi:hypothetical protein